MFKSIVIVALLLNGSLSPLLDTYIIEIPNTIDISNDGNFDVVIKENNLKDNQTLSICFPKQFKLSDVYGKSDIVGTIINNEIVFNSNSAKETIYYSLNNIPVGSWQGNLTMTIDLNTVAKTNVLDNPKNINNILKNIAPNIITFSNDVDDYINKYDVSSAKDESIILYNVDDSEIIISNNSDQKIICNDMTSLFANLTTLTTINNIDKLDLSECDSMEGLFENDRYLSAINGLNNLNVSNIKNMSYMFSGCSNITSVPISNWNTLNLENASYMFSKATKITSFDFVKNWNTGNLKDVSYMFTSTRGSTIDLSNWNVDNIESMEGLFKLSRFKDINLSKWNPMNCTSTKSMFESCTYLTNINNIDSLNFANVNNMSYMFSNTALTSLNLNHFNAQSVVDFSYFLYNNKKLTSLTGINNLVTKSTTNLSNMFQGCVNLQNITIDGWNTENVTDMSYFFDSNSQTLDSSIYKINGFESLNLNNLVNASHLFNKCRYLDISDLSATSLSSIKNIDYAFYGCWNINTASLENWKTFIDSSVSKNNTFSSDSGKTYGSIIPSWY